MKKHLILLSALACVALASCNPQETDNGSEEGLVFNCAFAEGFEGVASWHAGDCIGITAAGGKQKYDNVRYATSGSGESADFESTGTPIVYAGRAMDCRAIFPYTEGKVKIKFAIPAEYDGNDGFAASVWMTKSNGLKPEAGTSRASLVFAPATGIVKMSLHSEASPLSVKTLTAKISDGALACTEAEIDIVNLNVKAGGEKSDEIRWNFSSPLQIGSEPETIIFPVLSGNGGKAITVNAELSDGSVVELGRYVIPSTGIQEEGLTVLNFAYESTGRNLADHETANTYVVNSAGTRYNFPANVKGNGKARSFKWEDDLRSAGKNLSKSWTEADLAINPARVGVLWYTSPEHDGVCPIDIASLGLTSNGKAVFTTADPFIEGNVVIAAYDASGEILWSWNIWAVKDWDPENGAVQVGSYTLMDRNLGAIAGVDACNGKRKPELAIGNYYQWGRKDPFPAARSCSGRGWGLPAHTPVDELKRSGVTESGGPQWDDLIFTDDVQSNTYKLADALGKSFTPEQAEDESAKYPYKWMSSGSSATCYAPAEYSWMNHAENDVPSERPVFKHLWGCVNGIDVDKTIYDPCPPGWTVPPVDAMALPVMFTTKKENGYYNDKYDIYFPTAGYRSSATMEASRISDMGSLRMGTASVDIRRPIVTTNSNPMSLSVGYIGDACQIRCVRKESTNQPVAADATDPMDPKRPRCALMGDSVTEQWYTPLDSDRGRVEFFTENNFIGKGISGHASGTMLNRFMKDIIALDPQSVSISAGLNDIWSVDKMNRCIWDTYSNMAIMSSVAYQYCGRVIVALCTPSNFRFKDGTDKPHLGLRVIDLNRLLIPFADSHGWPYADYFTPLVDSNNDLKLELSHDDNDRVHPNRAGYLIMEPILLDAVSRAFSK